MSDQLQLAGESVDVDKLDTAKPLAEIFQPFAVTLDKWAAKVKTLAVTDINQKTEMAQARLARLEIKDARVAMEKTRLGLVEKLKERTGKIDTFARGYRVKMEALEAELKESEEFAIRYAAKVKSDLKIKRETELAPFVDPPIFLIDLSDLTEAEYQKTLENGKLLRQAKLDAAAKAEAERLAKIEADRVERERIAAENARLKALAEEQAKAMEEERKRVQAERAEEAKKAEIERKRIEAERAEERRKAKEESDRIAEETRKRHMEAMAKAADERKRIEAELIAQQQKEEKARRELAAKAKAEAEERARIEAARRAAEAAPDIEKLRAFDVAIRMLPIPVLQTVKIGLEAKVLELAKWVQWEITKLEEPKV